MGVGSMHLAWACLTRGWTPMAVMGMLTATFCAALFFATRGPVIGGAAVLASLAVSVWLLKTVKRPVEQEAPKQVDADAGVRLQTATQ